LLEATARRDEHRPAFRDQPNRERWTGRPRFEWSYGLAGDVVARLAAFFAGLGLPPRSPVGVYLPGGTEACLIVLALEEAGLAASLLPAAWTEAEVAQALDLAGVQAVVTQTTLGEDRPAELLCRLGARYYGLRFVCAFGPNVPDGVFDLDRVMLGEAAATGPNPPRRGAGWGGDFVTFATTGGVPRAVRRSAKSLIASAVTFLGATSIEPGDRILSLIPPQDHAGLATSLVAALVGGASLECHGLFEAATLGAALEDPVRAHLLAPGWVEQALAESGATSGLASTILLHRPPVRFPADMPLRGNVVDILALGEVAIKTQARDPTGGVALSFSPSGEDDPGQDLIRARLGEDGSILVTGLATEAHDFARSDAGTDVSPPKWRDTGFKAEVVAGLLMAVN
jgi:acyl-CoA synthetase (AMP-forming)/AMP-acid ligase II